MTSTELPVLTIDGSRFDDYEGFTVEFTKLLTEWTWRGHLDAFNDILRGGFGTPEDGFVLRWLDSARSRELLGAEKFDQLVEIILDHGPGGKQAGDEVHLELR
ncbi:hypothetical protein ABH935_008672 [Catenulispora sp. GAS73]|uniref:barstar family protein n=1 Tax=Catenulispora sp. GAS73 TaxID=3156269 RepID=UPI003511164D